jgi:hypothetical protein
MFVFDKSKEESCLIVIMSIFKLFTLEKRSVNNFDLPELRQMVL